jgi:hypothetical protein
MTPEALDNLTCEERRQVYGMMRLRVEVAADCHMKVRGILSDTLPVMDENGQPTDGNDRCQNELVPRCKSQITKTPEVRFHASLTREVSKMELALVPNW